MRCVCDVSVCDDATEKHACACFRFLSTSSAHDRHSGVALVARRAEAGARAAREEGQRREDDVASLEHARRVQYGTPRSDEKVPVVLYSCSRLLRGTSLQTPSTCYFTPHASSLPASVSSARGPHCLHWRSSASRSPSCEWRSRLSASLLTRSPQQPLAPTRRPAALRGRWRLARAPSVFAPRSALRQAWTPASSARRTCRRAP